jgi:hypothetical protein
MTDKKIKVGQTSGQDDDSYSEMEENDHMDSQLDEAKEETHKITKPASPNKSKAKRNSVVKE